MGDTTHYDVRIGNDVAMDTHCGITIYNDVIRQLLFYVTVSSDIAMWTYHSILMYNDVAMNLVYYNIIHCLPVGIIHYLLTVV